MTQGVFQYGLSKLIDFYGAKAFPAQRTTIVAQKLAILNDADFMTVCEDIIANRNQPPTLDVFMELSKDLRRLRADEREKQNLARLVSAPECPHCFNSGYEFHRHETHEGRSYEFGYGCRENCIAAQVKVPASYPRYNVFVFDQNAKRIFGTPPKQNEESA